MCLPHCKNKETMMEEEKTFCCQHCGKLLSTLSGLHRHGKKHAAMIGGSGVSDLCCRQFVDDCNLNRHKQRPSLRKHHCVVCGFSTNNLHYLKRHLKCHLGTKPYSCHICHKCFEWKGYLKVHVKTVHENVHPYSCNICDKQFKQRTSLNAHIASHHTGEKSYSCSKCPKSFVRASSLQEHMKWHLIVKKSKQQYSCHLCNNRPFLDKTCLAVHMASAHSHTKSYVCEVCGRDFKLKNCLRAHMQTHSEERPYYCQLCDGAFKSKKDLKKHQERHKSSKDHVCETCGKSFVTKNDVYLHQKVHDPSKSHRIYKPGKYKVLGGELLTALTRSSKLSLKEQEPISFDTEINATAGSYKLKNIAGDTHSDAILTAGSSCVLSSLGNKPASSESPTFDTLLNRSNDSHEFQGFHALESARDATSPFLSNSSESTTQLPGHELQRHDQWNSEELLEDYGWLDASSPPDDAVAKRLSPGKDFQPAQQVQGYQIAGDHTSGGGAVKLHHHDDSKSISGIESLASSLHELPYFDDSEEAENNSDVHLQSLNEYLNDELDNSQSLTQLNLDDFSCSLHSAGENKSHVSDNQSLTQVNLDDFSCSLHSAGENKSHVSDNQSLTQLNLDDFSCSLHSAGKNNDSEGMRRSSRVARDSLQVVDQASQSKHSCFRNVSNCRRAHCNSMLTADNNEMGFFTLTGTQVPRDGQNILLRSDHQAQSSTPGKLGLKNKARHLLIDFQMTSCDMFTDSSDTIKENIALHVRSDVVETEDHLNEIETVDQLTEVETDDHLTEVETDNHLTEVETDDHLTEVETDNHLTEVETDDHLTEVETDDHLTEVETDNHLTEVVTDNHLTDVETDGHLTEVETDDYLTENNISNRETLDQNKSNEKTADKQIMKDVLVEQNKKDVLVEQSKKDVLVEQSKKDVLVEQNMKDVLVEQNKKDVLVEQNMKDVLVDQNKKDVLVDQNKKDVLVEQNMKDVLVEQNKKDVLVEQNKKDVLVEQNKKDVLVEQNMKDVLVEQNKKDVLVDQNKKDVLVEQNMKDVLVDQNKKDVLVEQNMKDVLVEQNKKDVLVEQNKKDVLVEQNKKDVLVEQNKIMTTSEKCRRKYKLVELVSEAEEFSHGIVRSKKQRQVTAPCCKCPSCTTTQGHRRPCEASSVYSPTRFSCPDCGRCYTSRSNLKTHWSSSHAKDRQTFVCHLCGHVCNDRQNLGNHLVLHSSARPFQCDLCQKCFKTRAAIRVHLNKHLPCRMLFKCDVCPLFYNHFNSLQSHKRTHLSAVSLFTCSICGRQLSDKSNLTAHMRRHLASRKYQCPVCDKELSSAHSLRGHQGKACHKHQIKTLKAKEKAERCLLRNRTKEQSKISSIGKGDQ